MSKHNLPTEQGLYWASELPMTEDWELIVKIYGTSPFFRMLAWSYLKPGIEYLTTQPEKIYFGPKISIPVRDPRARPKDKQDEVH